MPTVHLDTNAYAAFKVGDADAVHIIRSASRIVISAIVVGELRAGFALGTRSEQNNRELEEFLSSPRVDVAIVDRDVAFRYAAVYKQLKRDGKPIPTNDLWIAAVAGSDPDSVLFTRDDHLRAVDGLRLVSTKEDFRRASGLP